ncbi:MAG: hypothetical protein HYY25_17125 [Candidatus Wallbacteria bacterium]|nr:hypothetical protein [Candidatus Wallbacteria bacterium]
MQKRVRASWSEPYLRAELREPTSGTRVECDGAGFLTGASDLRLVDGRLWVACDDRAHVALIEWPFEESSAPMARLTPLFPELASRHGTGPLPKPERPDVECLARLQTSGGPRLLALSSGATAVRRHAALLDPAHPDTPLIASGRLESFFEHLAVRWDIVGTELILEGAAGLGDCVRFMQRGNGAVRAERQGHNTVFDIGMTDWTEYFEAAMADPTAPFPHETICNIFAYDLGRLETVRATFSGADELSADWLLYAASAEASADVYQDGPTVGALLGLLSSDGRALQSPLRNPDGTLARQKVEGIVALGFDTDAIEVLLAVDPDGGAASPFLRAVLHGPVAGRVLDEVRGGAAPLRPRP